MTGNASNKTNFKPTAIDAYISNKQEIDSLLEQLHAASDEHFFNEPISIHWGHVGDLNNIKAGLKDLTDRVYRQGEYV